MVEIFCNLGCYGLQHQIFIFENDRQKDSGYCTFDDAAQVLSEYCNHYKANKLTLKGIIANGLVDEIYSIASSKYNINNLTIEVI